MSDQRKKGDFCERFEQAFFCEGCRADGVDADFHRAEKPNMHYGEPALVALGEPPYLSLIHISEPTRPKDI